MNPVPEWSEIKEGISDLAPDQQTRAFDLWEQDYAGQLAADPSFDREKWELFRVGTQVERANMAGEDPDAAVKSAIDGLNKGYSNVPYFNDNPRALYDDAEFEKVLPNIGNPIERAEARATRSIARDRKEAEWTGELANELGDLFNQANVDAKGPRVAGARVSDANWKDVKLYPVGNREVFAIGKPRITKTEDGTPMLPPSTIGRDVGDITSRIRAEGGDPEKLIARLKQARIWGNVSDEGNLARKLDDGRVVFNPEAPGELFDKDLVDNAIGKLDLTDAEKQNAKETADKVRELTASRVIGDLSLGSADWYESVTNPILGIGMAANFTEAIGLKSDFNAFRAANDDKYDDVGLVKAYFNQLKSKPKLLKMTDALFSGALAGTRQFALGMGETAAGLGTIANVPKASDALLNLQTAQSGIANSMQASGGQTVATTLRTGLDLATMIATGAGASSAVRAESAVVGQAARRVARRMAANASEKATLGPIFEKAVAKNVDDLASKAGRIVGEGTAALQSASGMFGDSYSANLAANLAEVGKLQFNTPEEKAAAEQAARDDAKWSATKDGLAAGVITSALMRLIPGGAESLLGKKIAEEPGKVSLRSLLKDVKATDLRTAFRSADFRTGVRNVAAELGIEAGKETVEEAADEAAQGLWASRSYNPNLTVKDFFKQVGTAAVLGGLFGAATNAGQSALTPGQATLSAPSPPAQSAPADTRTTVSAPVETTSPTAVDVADTEGASVPAETPEEAAESGAEIQSDVDEIVSEETAAPVPVETPAAVPAPPVETPAAVPTPPVETQTAAPTPVEAPIETPAEPTVETPRPDLKALATEISDTLPQAAAVLEEVADQPIEPEPENQVDEDAFVEAPQTPKFGDTLVLGSISDETGLPEYKNVMFIGTDDKGMVLVRDGNKRLAVASSDLLMNDQPVSIPGAKPRAPRVQATEADLPDVSPDTPPAAEVNAVNLPDNAQATGVAGSPAPRVVEAPSQPDVAGVSPAGETAPQVPVRSGRPVTVDEDSPAFAQAATQAHRTGIVPTPTQLKEMGFKNNASQQAAATRLAQDVNEFYPVNIPADAPTTKSKTFWGSVKRQVSYPGNTFTNDPETTAAQLMNGEDVKVPEGQIGLNPAIIVGEDGSVEAVNHPSEYVGRVEKGDTVRTVEDRYRNSPTVKKKSTEQLEPSLSPERQRQREAARAEAVSNLSPADAERVADIQNKERNTVVKGLVSQGFSLADAEKVFDIAVTEFAKDLAKAGGQTYTNSKGKTVKISFRKSIKDALNNQLKHRGVVEKTFNKNESEVSYDAIMEQSEQEAGAEEEADTGEGTDAEDGVDKTPETDASGDEYEDVEDGYVPEGGSGQSTFEFEGDEMEVLTTLSEVARSSGLIQKGQTIDEAVEAINEVIDVFEDDNSSTWTISEEGLGTFLLETKANNPEEYNRIVETFRNLYHRLGNTPLHSRSVAMANAANPLMSNISTMNDLGIVPNDPKTVEGALVRLAKMKEIPKFYRDTAALLLQTLKGRMPNLKVTSTQAANAAEYNPGTHEILMNMSQDNGQGFIGAFLHEMTHAATASVISNPRPGAEQRLVNALRDLKESLVKDLQSVSKQMRGYKEEMLRELGIDVPIDDPLVDQILFQAEADLMYAIGFDLEVTDFGNDMPLSYAYSPRGLDVSRNDDLQELAAHYFTDPMFRDLASHVSTDGGNMATEIQGILGSMASGGKTAPTSTRGKMLAVVAGWGLKNPRAFPNANNIFARSENSIRGHVQEWGIPPLPDERPTDFADFDKGREIFNNTEYEFGHTEPDTIQPNIEIPLTEDAGTTEVMHSRAKVSYSANNPFKKIDPKQVGGYRPTGIRGFGNLSTEVAEALRLKRSTEAAAQTAAKFFNRSLNNFVKKHGKTDAEQAKLKETVNSALGNTDVRITNDQWKATQKVYDKAKRAARVQFGKDMENVRALNQAGNTGAANIAYAQAVGLVHTTLENAHNVMVAQRSNFRRANVSAAQAKQSTAFNDIHKLDPAFGKTLTDFRKRLDTLSAEVAKSTGVSPELAAAINENSGLYLHRAYRVFESDKYVTRLMKEYRNIGTPPSPGQINPLRQKIEGALIAIREELIKETSVRLRQESRNQMINTYAAQQGITPGQAKTTLRFNKTPLNRTLADTQATNWVDATDEGRAALDRKFKSYATAQETLNPERGSGNLAPRDASIRADIVKRRKDLPKWLRELWGEYEDPYVNATNTLMELTAYNAQDAYLREIVKQGTGAAPFLTTAVPGTNGDVLVRLPGVDTSEWERITDDTRSPLNGYYAHPYVKEVLLGVQKKTEQSHVAIRYFQKLTGIAMMAKTVWSVQSHARNFFGNTFFIAANDNLLRGGGLGLGNFLESTKDAWAGLFGTNNADRQKFVEKLQRLGVLKDNQVVEILNQVSGAVDKIDFSKDDGSGFWSAVGEVLSKANEFTKDAYQAGDDFWKAFSFRAERNKIEAWKSNMTEDEKDAEAARRVRMTMPTYSMAPEWVKIIRKTGVIGAFVTFAAESLRVSVNIAKLGAQDMMRAPVGSAQWRQGATRLASYGFWQGVMGVSFGPIMTYLAQMLAHIMFGDEEEDKIKFSDNPAVAAVQKKLLDARRPLSSDEMRSFRSFLPDWQKDAQLWVIGKDKEGNISYMDVSYLNPLSYFPEIGQAVYRGFNQPEATAMQRITDAGKNGLIQAFKPFTGGQLFAGALTDIYYDVTKTESPVLSEGDAERIIPMLLKGERDPNAGKLLSSVNHLWTNAFMPGTLRTAQRIVGGLEGRVDPRGKAYNPIFEALSAAGFTKIETQNPGQMVAESLRAELSALTEASGELTRTANHQGTVSDATLANAVRTSEDNQFNSLRDMRRIYKNGLQLGLTPAQIFDAATIQKVGEKVLETVESGVYVPEPPTNASLKSFNQKVPAGDKQNRAKVVMDTYSTLPVRSLDDEN